MNASKVETPEYVKRQNHNRSIGKMLIDAGIPVFASLDKASMVKRWNKLDTSLSQDDKDIVREECEREGRPAPSLIGSTLDKHRWERQHNLTHRNGTASICCGLAGIVVIDADVGDGKNGPAKFEAFMAEHGGLPAGAVVLKSQSGGRHYIFADKRGAFGNAEGDLTKLDCNVRGRGGQIVAPGTWRADGKRYGTSDDLRAFIAAVKDGTLPELPECVAKAIGNRSADAPNDQDETVKAALEELKGEWPEYADVFADGSHLSLNELRERFPTLEATLSGDIEGRSRSQDRLSIASALKGAGASVRDFAAFCLEHSDICGEYVEGAPKQGEANDRSLARDWARATATNNPSRGEAFDAVEDDDVQSPDDSSGFLWGAEIAHNYEPAREAIQGLLPASGLVILQGDSNTGKTFLALEMLDCVSRERKFLGRNVVQGGAMLIAGEGRDGLRKRLAAIYRERPFDGRGIAVSFKLPNFGLNVKSAAKALEQTIGRYSEVQGHDLRLLVLDNLTRLIGGEDMNLAKGVSDMFSAIETLAHKYGLCVVLIHHHNKTGKGAGSFAIRAAADVVLDLSEGKGGVREIVGDKMRDGPKGGKLNFKLRTVMLGRDQWGEQDTSCVVDEHSAFEAVETEDEEAPTLKACDRREDRIACLLDVFESEAARQRADDESVSTVRRQLELQSGEIVRAVNARRRSDELAPLGRATIQDLIRAAVESRSLSVGGTKARPAYRLN